MLILGVSAFYHDSAAALIHDGEIVSAAQSPTGNWLIGLAAFDSLGLQQLRGIRDAVDRGRSSEI
jgi:hypothetical protein